MIQSIRLQHYRSYSDASFEFEPGVNIVVGPNASGKTNLIEAILLSTQGQSYRVGDADLIRHSSDWSRIDAVIDGEERTVKIRTQQPKTTTTYTVHNAEKRSLNYTQTIPVVLFEPNHLLLLTKSPELRRQYLDETISQLNPHYPVWLAHYRRSLSQRNNLLKQPHTTEDMFFVWEVRLSQLAQQIVEARREFVASITDELNYLYTNLASHPHNTSISYKTPIQSDSYGDVMLRELTERRPKDLLRGFTSLGPHRDDLQVQIDGHDIGLVASRGEARTIVLALKLIELTAIERARQQKPIMILDDVFSELDGARRKNLTQHLVGHQSFITTTDADIITHHFTDSCHIIAVG
jgi:DNA replication and repair protein RecF